MDSRADVEFDLLVFLKLKNIFEFLNVSELQMMSKALPIAIGLAMAVSYPYFSPHNSQSDSEDAVERKASGIAEAMNAITPKNFGDGEGTLVEVTANGRTLTMHYIDVPNWRDAMTPSEATKAFRVITCREPGVKTFIGQGGSVAFEAKDKDGRHLPTLNVASCPT